MPKKNSAAALPKLPKSPAFVQAVGDLTNTPHFTRPVGDMSIPERVEAYALAHFTEEISKARRENIREALLVDAESRGEENEKGGKRLLVGDYTVLRERRTASAPDEKKLMALLEAKGIATEQAFDRVTTLQANPSKVAELVANGHLTAEEAKGLYKATFALVVHASDGFTELVENACPAGVIPAKKRR